MKQKGRMMIWVDNKLAIKLTKNSVNHESNKHIDVLFHFIQEYVKEGNVEPAHVGSRVYKLYYYLYE